jgi:alpha/beta superfamily hydrolase
MNMPTWLTPALYGAGAGAIALAIVGFTWGGWVTGSAALKMANDASGIAVATSLTPYCLERSRSDPNSTALLAELKAANGFNRRGIVEKAGWATPLGSEQPDRALALACERALGAA